MNINLEQDANMSGVYAPSDATSFLSFDGSETRSSLDDTKKGNVIYSIISQNLSMTGLFKWLEEKWSSLI